MTQAARRGPPPSRGWIDSRWFRVFSGWLIANFIRLVRATNRIVRDPPERSAREAEIGLLWPAIFVSWHANIFALEFFVEHDLLPGEVVPLMSPHFDGQTGIAIARTLGYRCLVGTGVSDRQALGTGGVKAMRDMLRELGANNSVWLSAEVPPTPGRRVSPGVIALARASGRPIVVVAAASSRRVILEKLWDKLQINLPFGRVNLVSDGPLFVDGTISDADARERLKAMLDTAYAEALRRADA